MAIITIGVRPKNISWLEIALVFNHCITYFGIILIDIQHRLKKLEKHKVDLWKSSLLFIISSNPSTSLSSFSSSLLHCFCIRTNLYYSSKIFVIFDKIYPQHIRMVSKFALMVVSPNSKNGEEYCKPYGEVGRCLSGNKRFLRSLNYH